MIVECPFLEVVKNGMAQMALTAILPRDWMLRKLGLDYQKGYIDIWGLFHPKPSIFHVILELSLSIGMSLEFQRAVLFNAICFLKQWWAYSWHNKCLLN